MTGIDRQRFTLTPVAQNNIIDIIIKPLFTFVLLQSSGIYLIVALYDFCLFIFYLIKWKLNDIKQKYLAEIEEEYNYGHSLTFREFIAEPLYHDLLIYDYFKKPSLNDIILSKIKSFITNPTGFIIILLLSITALFLIPGTITIWICSLIILFAIYLMIFPNSFIQLDRKIKINYDYYATEDMLMYWKSIQDLIFKNTIQFLKDNGVDVSDFERAANTIINNSTIITAGDITGSQVAFGSNISQNTNQQQRQKSN